ncbi:hypothetical protein SAMD00024442_42_6 [Candidatus Symbiothrix dinenymphae]|nr:hypothetical protein SAMD00024442_42_6 [Candidatus Symbiothrix dinenymphae]
MKKYFILIGVVAAMYSCDNDIYDNIKEMVDTEKVYPAGYNQVLVSQMGLAGENRVEIDLNGGNRDTIFLPRAVRTVVEYDDTIVKFTPARTWVSIEGLTLPQTYNFKIYTEDEFGNKSVPVMASGKPFTAADKGALIVIPTVSVSTSQAAIVCNATNIYTFCGLSYNYTDKDNVEHSDTIDTPSFLLSNLEIDHITQVNIAYYLRPKDAIDTVLVADTINVKTRTQAEFNAYMSETQPFMGPHTVSFAAPCDIRAYDFDTANGFPTGEGKAFHDNEPGRQGGDSYRVDNGDTGSAAVEEYAYNPGCVGWVIAGEWLVYTIDVANAGDYSIETQHGGVSQYHIEIDMLNISGIVSSVNGWAMAIPKVTLTAGPHKIKYYVEANGTNFFGIQITHVP